MMNESPLPALVGAADHAQVRSLRDDTASGGTVAESMSIMDVAGATVYLTPKDAYRDIDRSNTAYDQIRRAIYGERALKALGGAGPDTYADTEYIYQRGIDGDELQTVNPSQVDTQALIRLYAAAGLIGETDVEPDNIVVSG